MGQLRLGSSLLEPPLLEAALSLLVTLLQVGARLVGQGEGGRTAVSGGKGKEEEGTASSNVPARGPWFWMCFCLDCVCDNEQSLSRLPCLLLRLMHGTLNVRCCMRTCLAWWRWPCNS